MGSSLLPSGVLDGVACQSARVCYAVGSNAGATGGQVVATTDGGSVWTLQAPPAGTGNLTG